MSERMPMPPVPPRGDHQGRVFKPGDGSFSLKQAQELAGRARAIQTEKQQTQAELLEGRAIYVEGAKDYARHQRGMTPKQRQAEDDRRLQ